MLQQIRQRPFWIILALALIMQAVWKMNEPAPSAHARDLAESPNLEWIKALDWGEHAFASQWLTLELFSHDEQPGVSLPYLELDYDRVTRWMETALKLDPDNRNILLAASHIYSQVPDPVRQRLILDFVHRQFILNPDSRWPYLAHAALVARHRLNDMHLALSYAKDLASVKSAPDWARQMSLLLLSDMGENEQARILLGGLLDSGAVSDKKEAAFLLNRINSAKK